jgi:hypothetical protein
MKIKIEKTITYFKQADVIIDIPAEYQKNEKTIEAYLSSIKQDIKDKLEERVQESDLGFSDETSEVSFDTYKEFTGMIVPIEFDILD